MATSEDFTVGEGDSCDLDDVCNGPLGDDKRYKVSLATCTSGGCTARAYSDQEFRTGKQSSSDKTSSGDPDYTALIVCMSLLIVALVVVIVGGVYMQRKKMWIFDRSRQYQDNHNPVIHNNFELVINGQTEKPVAITKFSAHVSKLHRDTNMLFAAQYEQIRELSPCHDSDSAILNENKAKNRYCNILPFDHTRVKLLPMEDMDGSDYINANYMPGYNSRREFIAAQGPLPGTLDDFWRMIWEQHVSVIVMLTNLVERQKEKCSRYWPIDSESVYYDEIKVTRRSESVIGDYTVRVLDISCGDKVRTVKQLHYILWPDFGCPDNTSGLLNLVGVVRKEISPAHTGPALIHCSAGVGRTGTFICVDRLLQHIQDSDTLDVFGTVMEMRQNRCLMVQSEDQYIYIHDCLNDAIGRGMHLGQNQNIYCNEGMDQEEEEGEPLYENWENGPDTKTTLITI